MNPAFIDLRSSASATDVAPVCRKLAPRVPVGAAERSAAPRPVWWLWPHLLSLDAPLVAVVWQRWWAKTAGVPLPPSRELILGLGVWLIYLADRLADTADGGHRVSGATRHVFSGERRRVLLPLALLIGLALVVLTPSVLPGVEFRAGLGLLVLALGYFWLIHCWPGRGWAAYLPKEGVVGGMFGAGSAFFVVCRVPHFPAACWFGVGLFAAVCFLNCAFITKWERHARDLHEPSSLLNAFPRLSAHLPAACVLLAAVALVLAGVTTSWFAVPVAASALLLAGLAGCATRLSMDGLRVLADLVLLTPWLGLAWASACA